MWQKFNQFIAFQGKTLEFKYNTWKSHRAIKKAYHGSGVFSKLFFTAFSTMRFLVIPVVAVALVYGLYSGGKIIAPTVTKAAKSLAKIATIYHTPHPKDSLSVAKKKVPVKQQAVVNEAIRVLPLLTVHDTLKDTGTKKDILAAVKYADTVQVPLASTEKMQYCILANKATKSVFLLSKDSTLNSWKIIEQLPAVMGGNVGQKQTSGDRRTPEGIYFIVGRKEKAELSELYGPLAYVLNYPNEDDRKAGRTGQGIWIHGMPEDSSRIMTRGCIVMQNTLLLTLAKYLKLGVGTPVVIVDKKDLADPITFPDFAAIEEKRKGVLGVYVNREEEFNKILAGWKTAWASRNIASYSGFYDSKRFFSSGMSWNAWRERKMRIFQSLDSIELSVDNIRVVDCSESTAVVVFRQMYAAEQSRKQNAKRLCFYRNDGAWLIYREETFSTEEFLL